MALALCLGCDAHPLDATLLEPSSLAQGLVAHYTFDEGDGSVAFDRSGNRRDAILMGSPAWIPDGQFDGGVRLGSGSGDSGAGAYVSVGSFPNASASWSVSAWIRPVTPLRDSLETILSTEAVFDGGWQFNLEQEGGLACHFAYWENVRGNLYALVRVPLAGTGWTHVAAVVDAISGSLSVYVNATLAGSAAVEQSILPGTADLYIGTWSEGTIYPRYFEGDVDDVAVYSRALVALEIAELFRHPPPDPQ